MAPPFCLGSVIPTHIPSQEASINQVRSFFASKGLNPTILASLETADYLGRGALSRLQAKAQLLCRNELKLICRQVSLMAAWPHGAQLAVRKLASMCFSLCIAVYHVKG